MGVAEDKLDIYDLFARYAQTVDGDDAEAWVNVFTDDGIFNYVLSSGKEESYEGREQLLDIGTRMCASHKASAYRHGQICPLIYELTENRAIARCYSFVTSLSREAGAVHKINTTGIYYDEIVRAPKGWRFKKRRHIADPLLQP